MFNLWFKAQVGLGRVKEVLMGKKKGLDGFVVVVIIIIIAVGIGLLFRDQLADYFKRVMSNLTTQSDTLISKPTP